jgi:hypothetical protein
VPLGSTRIAPAAQMTIVIVGTLEVETVATLASSLRRRGLHVLALESVSVVGMLLLTERVLALVVFETQVAKDWESIRNRLVEISPRTPILCRDARTVEQLACETLRADEE